MLGIIRKKKSFPERQKYGREEHELLKIMHTNVHKGKKSISRVLQAKKNVVSQAEVHFVNILTKCTYRVHALKMPYRVYGEQKLDILNFMNVKKV